jgi:hypothetical protein
VYALPVRRGHAGSNPIKSRVTKRYLSEEENSKTHTRRWGHAVIWVMDFEDFEMKKLEPFVSDVDLMLREYQA